MIIDRHEFKQLKKDGGGILKAIHFTAALEYGYKEIRCGLILNFYIMPNGIFGDIAFGKKIYISYDSIIEVEVSNRSLILLVLEHGEEKKIVLKIQGIIPIAKIYNTIRQNANLEYKEIQKPYIPIENKIDNPVPINANTEIKITEKQRIKELKKEHIPYCPKCHGISLQYVERRKRLSLGRTIVGGTVGTVLTGGIGLAVGATMGGLTSKKYKGKVKCLNCGHTWKL